jgi:hypothetical protein
VAQITGGVLRGGAMSEHKEIEEILEPASTGCNDPKCAVCGAGGPMYLHSRCHPEYPTMCILDGNILTIYCVVCDNPVASYRISERVK